MTGGTTIFEIDNDYLEEIKSILAQHGRPDLICLLEEEEKNKEYKPPIRVRRDSLSDSEGSAEEEAYDVYVDQHGFQSLM